MQAVQQTREAEPAHSIGGHMPAIVVIEMPLLAPGITCAFCGHPIHEQHVYSVEGDPYRCIRCANVQVEQLERLRANGEVCKEGM